MNQVTGDYIYSHDDLTVGAGAFPYGLGFQRSYDSGRSLAAPGILGAGWTHNFDYAVQRDSDGFEGMAATSPRNGAIAIATLYVMQDILNTPVADPKPLDRLVISTVAAKFMMDRLTNNVLRVSQPGLTESFVRLPDGTYNAPTGSASLLVPSSEPNGPFALLTKEGAILEFDTLTSVQPGRINRWRNAAGAEVTFAYNANGYLTSVRNNLGRTLVIDYAGTLVSAVYDGTGRSVQYAYDAARRLTGFTDPMGFQTTFAYAGVSNRLESIRYPSTPAPGPPFVVNAYDSLGRVQVQNDARGLQTYVFLAGRRTELAEPSGNRHVWYYDPLGRNVAEVQDFGYSGATPLLNLVTRREYDGQSRLTRTILPEGNSTAVTYDTFSNPLTVTQNPKPGSPLPPLVTTLVYDSPVAAQPNFRRVTTLTDPRGNTISNGYDPATGNLVQQQQPAVTKPGSSGPVRPTSIFAYTAVGLLAREQDPEGRVTLYEYAGNGDRLGQTVDFGTGRLALRTTYTYDAAGNPVTVVPPRGNAVGPAAGFTINQVYNLRRQLIRRSQPATQTDIAYTYDADGRPTGEQSYATFPGSRSADLQSTVTYTPTGQRGAVTDPGGATITYAYDGADRLLAATSSSGRQTRYDYDRLSRVTAITDAVAGALDPSITRNLGSVVREQRTYTPNSLLLVSRDGNNNPTTSRYDGFDRLDRTTYADTLFEAYGYDANGNITQRTTRAGQQITHTYDALNRLATRVVPATPAALSYTYSYDLVGRPLRLRQSIDAADATYAYDTAGRLTGETNADGRTITYTLDADGNRVGLAWPETGTAAYLASYAYDAAGRLSGVSEGSGAGAVPLGTYSYDTASRRVVQSYGNGVQTAYTWRPSGRVETLRHGFAANASVTFTYVYNRENGVSGRLVSDAAYQASPSNPALALGTRAYAPNTLNQYATVAGTALTYDPNGNLTGDGTGGSYSYDAQNRLVSATVGGTTTTYAYDPQGRRSAKTVSGATTRFLSAGSQEIAEYAGSGTGTLARRFVYGPGLDEPLATVTGDGAGRARAFHHADGLGSVVALTNAAGAVTERHAYTPFGVGDSTAGSPWQFAGRRLDAETGLYYQRARYYSPTLGRFLQMDPIGTADGLNLYAYVKNSPLNATDPTGLCKQAGCGNTNSTYSLIGGIAVAGGSVAEGALSIGSGALVTVGLPLLLTGDTVQDQQRPFNYATYTRTNPVTEQVYAGRTSGYGDPATLVRQRGQQQEILNQEGFLPPVLDVAANGSNARIAIRGREQQLINYYGGARSVGGTARNAINGVADFNPLGLGYIGSSISSFGGLPDRSPDRRRLY